MLDRQISMNMLDQKEKYLETFGRRFPFPLIEVKDIIVNPVHPDYFYVRKVQAINSDDFEIKSFVLDEDLATVQNRIREAKDEFGKENNEGGKIGAGSDHVDHFESAIERMRQNLEYNIDEFGNTIDSKKIKIIYKGQQSEMLKNAMTSVMEHEGGSSELEGESDEDEVSKEESETEHDADQGEDDSESEQEDNVRESSIDSIDQDSNISEDHKERLREIKMMKNRTDFDMQVAQKDQTENQDLKERWETMNFTEVQSNSKTLTRNPEVLLCCKIEPSGYSIEQKIYAKSLTNKDEFEFSKDLHFSSCGSFFACILENKVIVYNALNLEIAHQYLINFEYEEDKIRRAYLSHEAQYLCIVTKKYYYFYNGETGDFIRKTRRSEIGTIQTFVSHEELVGHTLDIEGRGTEIIKYNVASDGRTSIANFDSYFPYIEINVDGTSCAFENNGALFYVDLTDRDQQHMKIIEGYTEVIDFSITDDFVSLIYIDEEVHYAALYQGNRLLFRKRVDINTREGKLKVRANLNHQIVLASTKSTLDSDQEETDSSNQTLYVMDSENITNYQFVDKPKFHDPYLFYLYDENEIWMQAIDQPKIIQRYVFINKVSALGIIDDVDFSNESVDDKG